MNPPIETPQFLEEQRAQQSLYRGVFGTRSVLMRRNYLAPDFKNTANTNTLFTDGRLFAYVLPCSGQSLVHGFSLAQEHKPLTLTPCFPEF